MRRNNKTYNIVYHNSKKYTKGFKNGIKYFGDGIPATGTVQVTLNGNKNNVSVVISPNKPIYNIGESVTITVTKPYYQTITDTFTIQEGINAKSYNMNTYAAPLSLIARYRHNSTSVNGRQLQYAVNLINPTISISAERPSSGALTIAANNTYRQVNIGDAQTIIGNVDKYIKMTSSSTNPQPSFNRLTTMTGVRLSIMTYGNFNFYMNQIPLFYQAIVEYVAAPRTFSLASTAYLFSNVFQADYSTADFSDWTGFQLRDAEHMFSNNTNLNLDPRIFDYSLTTNMINMFQNTTFADPTMYDNFLIFLSQNYLNKALTFTYGGTYSSTASSARASLIAAGWVINDGGLASGTLNITLNGNQNGVTVTRTPNKTNYDIGEVVNISVSKPYYTTINDSVTIVQGVNNKSYTLQYTDPLSYIYNYSNPTGANRSLSTYIRNTAATLSTVSTIGSAISIPIASSLTNRQLGQNSGAPVPSTDISITAASSSGIFELNQITARELVDYSVMAWGVFSTTSTNTATPLFTRGNLNYVAAPRNFTSITTSYMFYYWNTVNYDNIDLSDWNGYRLTVATYMFGGHPSLNIDPRIFDLTNATNITNIFRDTTFTDPNMYDNWLIDLNTRFRTKALAFHYGGTYTSAGAAARASLISAGWTINDGGLV